MANKIMKTLTMGGDTYEIVDATAREEIEALRQNSGNGSGSTPVVIEVDKTLSTEGMAADAKATGDAINDVQSSMLKNLVDDDTGHAGTSGSNGAIRHITALGDTDPDAMVMGVGENSFSWGNGSSANGSTSMAFGKGCMATMDGHYSQAFGNDTCVYGEASTVIGLGTRANSDYQLVFGKYNVADRNDTYAMIVGNGTGGSSSARSNAATIDWDGNAWYASGITVGLNKNNVPTANAALHMIVSDTEPTSPTAGMLWFDIS